MEIIKIDNSINKDNKDLQILMELTNSKNLRNNTSSCQKNGVTVITDFCRLEGGPTEWSKRDIDILKGQIVEVNKITEKYEFELVCTFDKVKEDGRFYLQGFDFYSKLK